MANTPIENLRITFYGTQGSGSTFPSTPERHAVQKRDHYEFLRAIVEDLKRHRQPDGRVSCTIEELLGGAESIAVLTAYCSRFDVPEPRVYGGWTTCVRVETSDGFDIVLDCGSGFRNCAADLQAKWGPRPSRDLHIFGSHSHLDHTEGFDQAAICFDPRNHLHIYGNRQFLRALDTNLGIFTRFVADDLLGVQTPIFYGIMPAQFQAIEIRAENEAEPASPDALSHRVHPLGKPVVLGKTSIRAFEVFHPAPCLAYRFDHGGKSFVFCTDHELRHGPDDEHPRQQQSLAAEARLREFCADVDLLYRDGQYLRIEYDGIKGISNSGAVPRLDWGHSCMEDVREMASECRVKRTLVGHHDPNREWAERNWIDETLERASGSASAKIELAKAETVVSL